MVQTKKSPTKQRPQGDMLLDNHKNEVLGDMLVFGKISSHMICIFRFPPNGQFIMTGQPRP